MRKQIVERLEAGRVRDGRFATAPGSGPSGLFFVQGPCGCQLKIIGFVRPGWEHVSVSTPRRSPNWDEMCLVKDLFWDQEECVIQLHPPRSQYVNNSRYCLHLWRPTRQVIPMPPAAFVGIVGLGPSDAAILFAQISAVS
ncbi:DUF7694 domain-containing protein [Bradyrhizobium cytisi]|uniref:DUF7694 domain-containing protein n=1 Tax=Bradyrhizobium cytisi TaxID=515489 RepID=A0A5S4VYY3_9BRAD|nr:hypothetical protein [Bradyrhizobium cytisi]TYL73912.1 hypothetical protein FXB38_35905 [Bradyrhizobium cytisi]